MAREEVKEYLTVAMSITCVIIAFYLGKNSAPTEADHGRLVFAALMSYDCENYITDYQTTKHPEIKLYIQELMRRRCDQRYINKIKEPMQDWPGTK